MKLSSLKYFFTYETKIPDGIGFKLFGIWHILCLLLCLVVTVVSLHWYWKAKAQKKQKVEKTIALSLVGWMILRAIYIAVIGENFLYELPFHLCSMTGILCGIHCFTKWKWLGQMLYALCLPGAILALLFPNWNSYPLIHFISLEAILFHLGIILYVTCLLTSHEIVPQMKKMWQVIVFLAVVVPPIYVFDKKYQVNYMFVNRPSGGSPLEWLAQWMGNPGYLLGYAGLILLCIFLMDLGYEKFTGSK